MANGALYFSNDADRRLYRLDAGALEAVPLTPEGEWRYGDGVIDSHGRWIGVREDHTAGGEPVNEIVAINALGTQVIARGRDFFSSPKLSANGRLAYLGWDHPNMPWTARPCSWMALRSPAVRPSRPSSRNGRPTAPRCISSPTGAAGGTCIVTRSLPARRRRSRRWTPSSGSRSGCSECTPVLRGSEPDRLLVHREGARPAGCHRSDYGRAHACRDTLYGFLRRASGGRPRGLPRRLGRPARPRSCSWTSPRGNTEILKKSTSTADDPAVARYFTGVEQSITRARAAPRTRCITRRSIPITRDQSQLAAAPGEVPRRSDLRRVERARPAHPVLDEPRHLGARRELRGSTGYGRAIASGSTGTGALWMSTSVNGARFLASAGWPTGRAA